MYVVDGGRRADEQEVYGKSRRAMELRTLLCKSSRRQGRVPRKRSSSRRPFALLSQLLCSSRPLHTPNRCFSSLRDHHLFDLWLQPLFGCDPTDTIHTITCAVRRRRTPHPSLFIYIQRLSTDSFLFSIQINISHGRWFFFVLNMKYEMI